MADSNGGQSCRGLSWTIDPWANRTDQTVTVGTCNTFHQIVDTQNRLVGPPYQYDAAGNMTNDGSHTYTYDAENRLISVDGGATASYLYDAQGRRVRKSVGAAQTHYIYDLSGNVISELDQNSVWKNVYLRLDGKLFAQYTIGSPRTQFVHTDHLGSTRLLTGMTQSVVDSLDYLPYGEQIAGGSGTTHKFTGKERDSESGLDNFGARYDSSSMGRFMSPDPMGGHQKDPQTMNRYAYVRNNPLNLTDPTGLDFYLQCRDEKHNGCTQVQIDPKNDNQTWVQADKDGNATVITSDSIRDKENTATVDENGVQINGSQGIYFDNPASHTTDASGQDDNHNSIVLTGSGKLTDFNITINGNCSGTCLSSGTWSFPQGSWDNARETLNVRGSFYFPGEDLRAATGSGQHPYTTQHRFGGANCQMLTSCNNSPHLSVPYDPKRNVPQGFHVDAHGDMYHHNQDVSRQGVE